MQPTVGGDGSAQPQMYKLLAELPVLSPDGISVLLTSLGFEGTRCDPAVSESLNTVAGDFINTLVRQSAYLAALRGSNVISPKDMQVALAKYWNITAPGFSTHATSLQAASAERLKVVSDGAQQARVATRNGTLAGHTAGAQTALGYASTLHAFRAEAASRAQPPLSEAYSTSAAAPGGLGAGVAGKKKKAGGATGAAPALTLQATVGAGAGAGGAGAGTKQLKRRRDG